MDIGLVKAVNFLGTILFFIILACNLPTGMTDPDVPAVGTDATPQTALKMQSGTIAYETPSLDDVRTWLYLIDVNLDEETIEQIAQSQYDMVVLDFIRSESNNTDYPLQDVIQRIHSGSRPKLVLAYIDIGEAEEYRTYWRDDWGIGNPEWINSL